jgi:hypothetical protein
MRNAAMPVAPAADGAMLIGQPTGAQPAADGVMPMPAMSVSNAMMERIRTRGCRQRGAQHEREQELSQRLPLRLWEWTEREQMSQ